MDYKATEHLGAALRGLSAEAEAAEALSWAGMAYKLKLWRATIG